MTIGCPALQSSGESDGGLTRLPAVTVMITVTITVMIAIPIIAVTVAVPFMVVPEVAPRATPAAFEELATVITRAEPGCAFIWRASPIPFVPAIVVPGRVPITLYPHKSWPRRDRTVVNHARSRRRADPNTN
jgi:hypothetical protein